MAAHCCKCLYAAAAPSIAVWLWLSSRRALTGYQVLEDTLEGKKFLVNETFTAADIAVRSCSVLS
jgi:glutathione S-transferase